jgi:hypothetical protein
MHSEGDLDCFELSSETPSGGGSESAQSIKLEFFCQSFSACFSKYLFNLT